jgi:fatty acid desaturase
MATTTSDTPRAEGEPSGEEFLERARPGLSAAEVRELSRLDPLRSSLSLAVNWTAIALFVTAALRWPRPAVVAAAMLGLALCQHGLAVLAHEAAHYRLYQTRWLNDLLGKLCGAPLGISMLGYRVIHRIHHNHLYEPIDPDLALMAGYPRGRLYLLKKLLKDLTGVTTFKNYRYFRQSLARSKSPTANQSATDEALADTSSGLRKAARRDARLVGWAHLAAIAVAIGAGWWRWYLLLWLLPLVTVLQMILRLRAVCEHGAVPDLSTPLKAARTTLAPFWVRWLIFPHHVNYHIEHHLYPSVPHYRLAECHRRLAAAGALDGAEVTPHLGVTFRRIFAEPMV